MLASQAMREHHAFWHAGRQWKNLSPSDRTFLEQRHYHAPRQTGEAGAGLDFLAMHRNMIVMVNQQLAGLHDPAYPQVQGWHPIPFNHADADYPMPPAWPGADQSVRDAKSQAVTTQWEQAVNHRYESTNWLATQALDAVGSEIEQGIHNWLHMHWASEHWFKNQPGQDENDVRNDFLGSTYSSHVNKRFWKLHGWIDDRITQWKQATQQVVDFSNVWEGPGGHQHHMMMATLEIKAPPQKPAPKVPESLRKFFDTFFANALSDSVTK